MNISKGFGSIYQVLAETEMKSGRWLHQSAIFSKDFGNQSVQQTDVICPEPRKVCNMVGGLERFTCKQRSVDMPCEDDPDIINLLGMDAIRGDSGDKQTGYFRGTPPERTSNPLIRDELFIRQNFSPASPLGLGNTRLGLPSLPSLPFDWQSPPCGSSFSPKIRVEGFSSDKSSESGSIVSARA